MPTLRRHPPTSHALLTPPPLSRLQHLCKNKLAFPTHGDIPHGGGGGGGAGADGATPYVLGPVKTPHGYTRGAAATPAAGNTVALAKLTMLRKLFEKGTLPLDVFMAEMAKLQ